MPARRCCHRIVYRVHRRRYRALVRYVWCRAPGAVVCAGGARDGDQPAARRAGRPGPRARRGARRAARPAPLRPHRRRLLPRPAARGAGGGRLSRHHHPLRPGGLRPDRAGPARPGAPRSGAGPAGRLGAAGAPARGGRHPGDPGRRRLDPARLSRACLGRGGALRLAVRDGHAVRHRRSARRGARRAPARDGGRGMPRRGAPLPEGICTFMLGQGHTWSSRRSRRRRPACTRRRGSASRRGGTWQLPTPRLPPSAPTACSAP